MKLWLLLLAVLVAEICLAEETTVPPRDKNDTGPGRYGSGRNHHRNYDHDNYGKHRRHRTPIVDDYICDLEATILVVSSKHHVKEEKPYTPASAPAYGNNNAPTYGAPQQSYGNNAPSYGGQQAYGESAPSYGGEQKGYENKPKRHEYATPEALRLKCSHIAVHSEHDCHTCCQLSARRYHSVSKHEIFGFIIDASEIKENDKGYNRPKRDAEYGNQPAPNYQSQGYGAAPTQSYQAPAYSTAAPSYSAPEPSYSVPEYQEQPQTYTSDSDYQAATATSYAPKEYAQYGPPKSARCVCCSPKRHDHHKRRRHYEDRSYDRSDSHSNEY